MSKRCPLPNAYKLFCYNCLIMDKPREGKVLNQTFSKKVLVIITNLAAIGIAISTHAASLQCSKDSVAFEFETSEGLEYICEKTTKVIRFLESIDLQVTDCITIKLVDDFPAEVPQNLFGYYVPRTHEVSVLTYSRAKNFASEKPHFGSKMTKDMWSSFASHELAHAIIDQNKDRISPSRLAEEYIACITQLTTLEPEDLNNFLEAYGDVDAYLSIDEMSDTYYLLDPNRFAVKCYRHYLALNDPKQFIGQLIHSPPANRNETERKDSHSP